MLSKYHALDALRSRLVEKLVQTLEALVLDPKMLKHEMNLARGRD